MKEMIKKLQKRSNKKGFTLVEIIVVLVILAILAAIAVPAVLGYINDAKDSKYIQEARSIYIVVQTEEARYRAENDLAADANLTSVGTPAVNFYTDTTIKLKDTASTKTGLTVTSITYNNTSKVYTLVWTSDGKKITGTLTTNKDVKITHS